MASSSRRVIIDARQHVPFSTEFYDDALHLSPAGARRLAEAIFHAIKLHGL